VERAGDDLKRTIVLNIRIYSNILSSSLKKKIGKLDIARRNTLIKHDVQSIGLQKELYTFVIITKGSIYDVVEIVLFAVVS